MADLLTPTVEAPSAAARAPRVRRARPRPTSIGLRTLVVAYVGILVALPIGVVFYRTFKPGLSEFFHVLGEESVVHAYQVTAVVAGTAVLIDVVFGVAVAILLVRYRFPGKRVLNAIIDLPVAVSPIIVGLALILVFGPDGWFGPFVTEHGVTVIGAKPGMILATAFVSMPLVARAIIPVLEQAGMDQEQAAASLGANAFTRFWRITLPTIRAALTYGTVLTIARCLGEYGAVLVVSYNIQDQTETMTLKISNFYEFDQNDNAAYAVTFVLMFVSFVAIGISAYIRRRGRKRS